MATIDVGPGATDRSGYKLDDETYVALDNPANDTGSLDVFEFWFDAAATGCKIGTFYGSSTSYTPRDYESVGSVAKDAKITFSGLSCSVSSGDFLGTYYLDGRINNNAVGYSGVYCKSGDQFGAGTQTYSLDSGDAISIYATGATVAANTTVNSAIIIGNKVTASRIQGSIRNSSVLIGNVVTASKAWGVVRSSSVIIGQLVTASRLAAFTRNSAIVIGNTVSASRTIAVTYATSIIFGSVATASRSFGTARNAAVIIGNAVTASRIYGAVRNASVIIGNVVTASRALALTRSTSVIVGNAVTASRTIAVTYAASVIVGVKVTATKSAKHILTAAVTIGMKITASSYMNLRVAVKTVKLMALRSIYFVIGKRDASSGTSKKDVEIGL